MKVTQEGIYADAQGKTYPVVNLNFRYPEEPPDFQAYFEGGWYNVNESPENFPFDRVELEVVRYIGPIPPGTKFEPLPR